MPDRMDRLWTTQNVSFTLAAADIDSASEVTNEFGQAFVLAADRELRNVTVGGIFVNGIVVTSPATTPSTIRVALGFTVAPDGMDAGDFPLILPHNGDWMLHHETSMLEPDSRSLSNVMEPQGVLNVGGAWSLRSRSMRKISKRDWTLHGVMQKGTVTEGNLSCLFSVTVLWLIP